MRREIAEALEALAGADRKLEGSRELEMRVRAAFRAQRRNRRMRQAAAWTIAAAAALVMIAILTRRHEAPPVMVHTVRESPAEVVTGAAAPAVAAAKPVRRAVRLRDGVPREIVTDFFPLIDAPPPLDRGELVRVMVPASAMRTVGLPVREDRLTDRVKADVLVSEDGLATAIRFVSNE